MSTAIELKNKTPKQALKDFFGFDSFKGLQEEIIQSVIEEKDCFVIMPTGAGKSLCYQLPALMKDGTAIIISPLIALMKNQVDAIRGFAKHDATAHFLNSSLNKAQITQVKQDIVAGQTKLLYVAPETLKKEETIDFLRTIKVSFVAVDEAHCISEWGHDFRPEYRRIREMVQAIDDVTIIALTATATPKVQGDIQKNLGMNDSTLFKSSFHRDNLFYDVRPKGRKDKVHKDLIGFIQSKANKCGIIYCLSRKRVEEIAKLLELNGVKALPYHAGLDAKTRANNQDAFLMEDCNVIVATIAFGMGIDKPDVRFVIHYDVPKSLEGYYQETGRGGRDGIRADCLLYYNPSDIEKLEKFMKDKPVAEREIGTLLIDETSAYAETSMCRTKYLLHYFGENLEKDCEHCDNCISPKPRTDITSDLQEALATMDNIGGEFELSHWVNLFIGKKTDSIKAHGHDKQIYFGFGKDKDKIYWKSIMRLSQTNNYVFKNIEKYGLYSVSKLGLKYINKPIKHEMAVDTEYESVSDADFDNAIIENIYDEQLFALLKDIRKSIAKKLGLPPYVIVQEPALEDMASKYPITIQELENINGVGKNKAAKFGKEFVDFIAKYVEENEIERELDIVVKSSANKSQKKVAIILNIDKKQSLDDIAKSLGMEFPELIEELEHIVSTGTKLDLNYYLDEIFDEDFKDEIFEVLKEEEDHNPDEVINIFEGDLTHDEVQLMKIQFISNMS
jgi:ATP-dependent DNA helicase RecQ